MYLAWDCKIPKKKKEKKKKQKYWYNSATLNKCKSWITITDYHAFQIQIKPTSNTTKNNVTRRQDDEDLVPGI